MLPDESTKKAGVGVRAMDRIEQDKDSAAELKRKLVKRLGLAAVLIVVLLGALAMFDRLSTLEREEAAKNEVTPVQPRLGPSISSGRPAEPALPAEEPITPLPALAPKQTPPAIEPPPKPEIPAQPTITQPAPVAAPAPVPPPAAASAKPTPPAPLGKPAPIGTAAPATPAAPVAPAKPAASSPLPAAPKPVAPVSPIELPKTPVAATVPEGSSSSPMLGSAAPAKPSAPARLPAPAATPAPARPALSRLIDGFVLQAGVFTSTERAEELKAKLVMAGVPVIIESRVQVGPFKTQKEADAARRKIQDLGIDSILIPPRSGRR